MKENACFVNFSNHPLQNWCAEQKEAAVALCGGGTLVDVPFPKVPADADEETVRALAHECAGKIAGLSPAAVMCAGEYGVCFAVVQALLARGICCVYACTERQTTETVTEHGTEKRAIFVFRRFRQYERM